jgi:ATP dependent DNA ligase-like protein
VFVGYVERGVTRAVVAEIARRCPVRPRPACEVTERSRGVVWVEPRAVVDVTFSELMLGRLRDPVLRGLSRALT